MVPKSDTPTAFGYSYTSLSIYPSEMQAKK